MADQTGFFRLGDALAGDSELEYQKGLQLGANTENALAEARARKQKSQAQLDLADQIEAAGIDRPTAVASSTALSAGANLGDVLAMMGKRQEIDFRTTAGDPTKSFLERNTALQGLAPAPVSRYDTAGTGLVQDKFSDALEPTVAPTGTAAIRKDNASAALDEDKLAHPDKYKSASAGFIVTPTGIYKPDGKGDVTSTNVGADTIAEGKGKIANEVALATGAGKAANNMPKSFAQFRNTTDNANQVQKSIDDALKDVSWTSAGPSAWASREIAGTPAFLLDQAVLSIKANAGFGELSKMRHESPTGGALGNVTEQELKFLQSAIASLDTKQDPAVLAANLQKVRDHYQKYKEYAAEDFNNAKVAADYRSLSERQQAQTQAQYPGAPQVGFVDPESGFRYKGGDPNAESSWERAQ